MKKVAVLFILIGMLAVSQASAQTVKIKVVTARGKNPVFADTVLAAHMKATLANWDGFFRIEFKEKGFEGAFNFPMDYKGKVGVDESVKMTFQRKDAHFFGVVTIKRDKKDLILLTKSPKDVADLGSEIISGVWSNTDRKQTFVGHFKYQTYTYDEEKFQKRDFIVEFEVELPFAITWRSVKRSWKPEHLPDPLPALPDSVSADSLKSAK